MSVPSQYRSFQNRPTNQDAGISVLQPALLYYMTQGQQIPFFINKDWLLALKTFCDSGIVNPRQIGGNGPVIVENNQVYTIEPRPNCGPDETDRYENVYRGTISTLQTTNNIKYNVAVVPTVVRGGSAANGLGGPWGTGGIDGPDPTPTNSVDHQSLIGNVNTYYTTSNNALTSPNIDYGTNYPVGIQGIA